MSQAAKKKYLLVRPMGGLNDNLTQIEACWRYAEKYGRHLLIDTLGSSGFNHDFSDVFRVVRSGCSVSNIVGIDLDDLVCIPGTIKGSFSHDNYSAVYDDRFKNFVDTKHSKIISFDFSKDYEEELLVHHQCGGGLISIHALSRLRFNAMIVEAITSRLRGIPVEQSFALHIRHSDYKTDYQEVFLQIEERLLSQDYIYLATDSREVYQFAMGRYGPEKLIAATIPPETGGMALHGWAEGQSASIKTSVMVDQFVDLMCLAKARDLHISKLSGGAGLGGYSGFSLLAKSLRSNRWIVDQLLVGVGPQGEN